MFFNNSHTWVTTYIFVRPASFTRLWTILCVATNHYFYSGTTEWARFIIVKVMLFVSSAAAGVAVVVETLLLEAKVSSVSCRRNMLFTWIIALSAGCTLACEVKCFLIWMIALPPRVITHGSKRQLWDSLFFSGTQFLSKPILKIKMAGLCGKTSLPAPFLAAIFHFRRTFPLKKV